MLSNFSLEIALIIRIVTRVELKGMYRKSLVDNKHVGHESSGSSQVDNASSPVAQQGGTEDFGRGKDAWNRFLKSKQGLGLNRQQLKDLYHKQLRFHRARSVARLDVHALSQSTLLD